MFKHDAVTTLDSGIVVDKSKMSQLGATDLAVLLGSVYSMGKPVVIVEHTESFFTSKKLLAALDTGSADWKLIAEHFGIRLTPEDLTTLSRAMVIRNFITDAVKAMKPAYQTAAVPKNWSVESHFSITAQSIRRSQPSPEGRSTHYGIGLKMLERVWLAASQVWAKVEGAPLIVPDIRAEDANRKTLIFPTSVDIGCQSIARYELEQLALHKGWAFP